MRRALVVAALALAGGRGCHCGGPCPRGADLTGQPPPGGTEQWCQRRDGDEFVKHGPYTRWYPSGQKEVEATYVDGRLDGAWREWHPNGQLKIEGTYARGERAGRWLRWDADGRKAGEQTVGAAAPVADAGPPDAGAPAKQGAEADWDQDWVDNGRDNCPSDANPEQEDLDRDGKGDVCDDDRDGDAIADAHDNCVAAANRDQVDTDGDRAGDACDDDLDGDGAANARDNCPRRANPDQTDGDGDGTGDDCEPPDYIGDMDADGIPDAPDLPDAEVRLCAFREREGCYDNCPSIANPDQNPGVCQPEADADGDGVPNGRDNCIHVPNPGQEKTHGQAPAGFGDACDDDQDGDGVRDLNDNCVYVRNPDQRRTRARGPGDACVLGLRGG